MSLPPPETGNSRASGELRVVVLGPLRFLLKIDEFQMPFPDDGSQHTFWKFMLKRFPEMHGNESAIRLARNSCFLLPEESLNPGDEIALIPPVSGG